MKTVMILNKDLNPGLAANTAAVLGISLGHAEPRMIGPDLPDASQTIHPGITSQNIPVLAADQEALKIIYARTAETDGIDVIGFNTIAHKSRDYGVYADRLSQTKTSDLAFSGLCIRGPKKTVNQVTGSLKLYG